VRRATPRVRTVVAIAISFFLFPPHQRIIACDPGGLELLRLGWGGSPLLLFQGVFRVWSWVGGGRRILFFFSFQNVPWLNEELVKSVFDA
jgi:hypothetical protein